MSIDIQETIKAIRDMAAIIDPDEDYYTIVAAEEKLAAAEIARKKALEDSQAELKAASKTLEAARISATRPASIPSAQAHADKINKLDARRISLLSKVPELEDRIVATEAALQSLKDEAHRLETTNIPSEHAKELDGSILRLQLFKGLGFEPVLDPKSHKLQKMIIRSQSGDVHSYDVRQAQREGKSDMVITKELWQLAGQ